MKLSRLCLPAGLAFRPLLVTASACVLSCATTASVLVTRPPLWDTGTVRRIAVDSFDSGRGAAERQLAQFLTTSAQKNIQDTGKFILVDYAEIARLERSGKSTADYADAVFSGVITRLEVKDRTESDKDKNDQTYYTHYREVNVEFSYSMRRTSDGVILGQAVREDSRTESASEKKDLSSPYEIARTIAAQQMEYLKREIAPWRVSETRVFEEDKTKDPRMKEARAMVKARDFQSAYAVYRAVYASNSSFAAGFNAALCTEIQGDTAGAALQMRQLWESSSNPKALQELARMQKNISDLEKAREYGGGASLIDSAVTRILTELLQKIPRGSRVSVVGANGQNTLDYAVDELSAAFANSGAVTVVDRRQISAIIAEQRFQMSGDVSDETAISIGHLSGSQIIIACSLTGSGSLRRLRVRAISVEKGEILYEASRQL
ncbi:MAG: CsgG/HfaB family protein [Treponema sp.]|jgi:hypothetical protein|nr:CsgG/HfaB family protein [Treponema sp.]